MKRLTEENVSVGNTVIDTYSYEYDDYGNRSKMTATGSENYITEYDYIDSNGNYTTLLQKETRTVEVADSEDSFTGLANNPAERLNNLNSTSNVKETVYTYDANGSQITKATDEKTETNTYNAVNQLVGFTDGETTASYTYNAYGLRASKTVDGETVKHVWDGAKQIIADVKNGAFYQADCYIRGTSLVAKYNFRNGAKSEYTYYTQNAHGDVVNLTDADGELIKTYRYDAFGVEKNIDDADTNAFRCCGEYYDCETGTIYLRARHYNPSNGRFTQRDSFAGKQGDPLSLNLYTYCHNNPIANVDPSGHFSLKKAWNNYWDNWKTGAEIIKDESENVVSSVNQKVVRPVCQWNEIMIKSNVKEFMINHKSGVDQIQDWLGQKSFTSSLGISVGGGMGHTSGSLSGAFVFDSQGNLVLQGSFALGNTTAPTTWSVGLNSSITNAPNYTKLEGNGWTCGGSAVVPVPSCPVVGVGAGADVVMIPEGEDEWKYTGGMGSVLVGSPGIEVHGEYGRTITVNSLSTNIFNDYNKVYERVMSWANNYN